MVINWGVIGCGGIARRRTIPEGIIPAENSRLLGLMDVQGPVAAEMARELGVKAYADEEALLSDPDIDAVYIATPVDRHRDQAVTAFRAGKHVLVEKPMALTTGDCEAMIREAAAAGLRLGVGYMMRFHGLHRKVRSMLAEGQLGTPVFARAQLSCWYPPMENAWRQDPARSGGGALVDMGNHCLDLLEYILGSRVAELSCFTANREHRYPVEDTALLSVSFENGVLGSVDCSFAVPDNSSRNLLEVYGARGSILAEGTVGQGPSGSVRAFIEREEKGYEAGQQRPGGESASLCFDEVNTYRGEIEEFAAAVIEKRHPLISGEDGLWSQKLMEAAYRSAGEGRRIKVSG